MRAVAPVPGFALLNPGYFARRARCPSSSILFQIVFTASTYSYQIQSEQPAIGGQACLTAFGNVGGAVPLMGSGVALGANITLTFSPGGGVSSTPAANPIQMTLTYPGFTTSVPQEVIQVSNYGNITVTP